jgi:preprotein translocase subunit SecG
MGILLALHVIVTVLLIFMVLIQKNEGGSSLFASSGGSGMFNARGTSSVLTKTTWVLASIFLVNCVVMAQLASSDIKTSETLLDQRTATDEAK